MAAAATVPQSNFVSTRLLPDSLNIMRNSIRIATWNVLTLNPPGHSTLLSAELSRLNVSIAGLQEARWLGSGETRAGDYKLLWSGHDSERIQGVALALDKTSASALSTWKPLGSRLLYARLKHSQGFLSIFVCYAPTDTSDDDLKATFYETLDHNLRRVSPHDIVIILGDINATIGPNRDGVEHVVGPFTSTSTNDNGDRMIELCSSHNLKVASTWFQHRQIHTTSWYSNTGVTSKTIDHILISGRWKVLSDCRVFRSAELGSTDHRLVAAKLHLHLKRTGTTSRTEQPADNDKLLTAQYAHLYSVEVSNRFAALDNSECIETSWQQFSGTLISAAHTVLGKRRKKKKKWISSHTLDIVEKCREARLNGNTTRYKALKKTRKRNIRKDRTIWLNSIADAAERDFNRGNLRSAYKSIKELCTSHKKHTSVSHFTPLLSSNGSVLTETTDKLARWKEHYEKVLCRPTPHPCVRLQNFANAGTPSDTISLEPPTLAELKNTISRLPLGRTPGADGITAEMLKSTIDDSAIHLEKLFKRIWDSESVPLEWKEGIITSIYKNKGDSRDPTNYRPITLLSVPSKIFTSILLQRMRSHLISVKRPQQAGFTPCRSTTDCILSLRVMAQQRREFRKTLFAAYVDLKGAFDSLDRTALWLLLQGIGIPTKYVNILKDLYSNTTCRVRAEGSLSDSFRTTSGVRQGCVAAPNLFNVAVDYWVNNALACTPDMGVNCHSRITDLCYADDVVVFADFIDTISDALVALHEEATPLGLTINWTKTKVQSLSDFLPPLQSPRSIANHQVEVVDKFLYLGSKVTSDCSSDSDIMRRVQLTRSSFGRLHPVWHSSNIRLATKMRLLNSVVLPVLLYGSETWTLTDALTKRLDAFHRSCLRNILGIRWFHHIRNETVYARAGDPVLLSTTIKRRRLRLFGHVARLEDNIPAKMILADATQRPPINWSRPRGRPRLSWLRQVSAGHTLPELVRKAQDRVTFRTLVATVT